MGHRAAFVFVVVMLTGALAGCSQDSKHATVSGNVMLDGAPLKMGIIRFMPADGQTASADGTIVDGKYSAQVPPGDKKLSLSAPKVVGKKKMYDTPESPTVDIVEELLPAIYNVKSDLTMAVTAGSQTKDFELKSK